jgi:hypothetical protein
MQLYTAYGIRKYFTAGERDAFCAKLTWRTARCETPCMTLAYAGCSRRTRGCAGVAQRAAVQFRSRRRIGHAQLSTTAVYANAVGAEEKDIARRMWG